MPSSYNALRMQEKALYLKKNLAYMNRIALRCIIWKEINTIVTYCPYHAWRNYDIICIFGDLKDTPDNSKKFHYRSCRIPAPWNC